jgi:U3 small nucleolar RNA-associated protein 21
MSVLFRIHYQDIMADDGLVIEALREWGALQEDAMNRLDGLVGYCTGVVRFLRNPRA